jgi:hypothetical protein
MAADRWPVPARGETSVSVAQGLGDSSVGGRLQPFTDLFCALVRVPPMIGIS